MREDHKGRSRREREQRKGGRPGCLILVALLFIIIIAGAVFFMDAKVQQEETVSRESSTPVETLVFPGDEKPNAGDAQIGGKTTGAGPLEITDTSKASEDAEMTPDSLLAAMSTEEKVLQLFMLTPEALTGADEVFAAGARTQEAINQYPIGGIVYFKQNLRSKEQVTDMITGTQKYSRDRIGVDMLIGVDEEGGQVARISGREEFGIAAFEDMSEVGAAGDPKRAYEVGDRIGAYLSEMGFNMDFAPVADVLTNPENTVVARRSFGSDGAVVSAFVKEKVKGMESHGVSAVLKHFPGHGGTSGDTHEGYAYTERTLDELMAEDLVPFKEGIDAGIHFVMAAHISAPNAAGDDTPASLSEVMITDVLRNKLGFDGIVITDALNMGAITQQYSSSEAAVKALQAGVDILLMPENFSEAYNGVLTAVKHGTISEERLNQSVRRILRVKLGQ